VTVSPLVKKKTAPRGFALVVIVIVGVAVVAIAIAVVSTAGSTRMLSTKTASFEHAQAIAEAGLERAAAYAKAVVRTERDFDRLLDPNLDIDCVAPPADLSTSEWGVPRYLGSGVTTVSFPAGSERRFKLVPFNDGAYLTRFDDDDDDRAFNFELGSYTSNNLGASINCLEGPLVPDPANPLVPLSAGAANGTNPFRDCNRGIWLTVIGIFPGTDPAEVTHRVTLRRFISSNERGPVPIVAARSLNVTSANQRLNVCSVLGDVAVDTAIDAASGARPCGYLRSFSTIVEGNHPAPGSATCVPRLSTNCTSLGNAQYAGRVDTQYIGSRTVAGPFQAPLADFQGYNFDSKCNFLLDADDADKNEGLYFWDALNTRGAITCDHAAVVANSKVPKPSSDINALGSCWVPLGVVQDNVNGVVDPFGFGEFTGDDWRPKNLAVTWPLGTPTTVFIAGPHIYSAAVTFAAAITKPDWASECNSAAVNFSWNAVAGSGLPDDVGCTTCDGTRNTFRWGGDGTVGVPLGTAAATFKGGWHFDPTDWSPLAYPAGVYRFVGQPNFYGPDEPQPADENTRNEWPAVTLVFTSTVTLKALPGANGGGPVGVGTDKSDYPSVVVLGDNNLIIEKNWAFAGGVYAAHLTIASVPSSNVHVYGLVRSTRTLTVGANSTLSVFYDNDLVTSPQETIVATPTRTRTLP
jgi:hypothetical protein